MTHSAPSAGASPVPEGWDASPPALLGHSRTDTPTPHHRLHLVLTLVTFVVGCVAFGLGLVASAHVAATALGLIGVAFGLYCQLTSESTSQRWFDVIGLGAAAIGMGLGFGHGGFGLT
jgi:hypothetical protein